VYLNEGYEWIVDIDLEKFFDNVPQDRLMSLVHDIVNDGDTESLIRKYLKAGVMTQQGYEETNLGTPREETCRRCSQTLCWTRNWKQEGFVLRDTQTTV
jgi:retron-type reverse transcriptase